MPLDLVLNLAGQTVLERIDLNGGNILDLVTGAAVASVCGLGM